MKKIKRLFGIFLLINIIPLILLTTNIFTKEISLWVALILGYEFDFFIIVFLLIFLFIAYTFDILFNND